MTHHRIAAWLIVGLALVPAAALAQTKVSHLPAGAAVASSDLVPMSQSCSGSPPTATCTATNAVTAAQLKTFTSASPTLVTPQLGVATATTFDGKNAISSITLGAAAQFGTGATAVCATSHVCTSIAGEITLTTGTGTLAGGTLFTVNFADTRTNIPNCIVPNCQVGSSSSNGPTRSATTSTLAIGSAGALLASTTYTADYACFGN